MGDLLVDADLADALAAACRRAHAELPNLAIDDRALAAAIERGAGDDLAAHLADCHVADLALALAALERAPGAIEELEQRHGATIGAICRRFTQPGASEDDLRQVLRAKLYVAPAERRPKLAEYDGRGSLDNWLRVTATREFIDLTRRKDRMRERGADDEELGALLAPTDVGLEAIKAEYRAAVKTAMFDAVHELEAGDRHLLRQHLGAGLTIDQLAVVLGIHRATVARRIARAREQLAERCRALVAERLGLSPGELVDVYTLVRSRLELSFATLLATRPQKA